MKKLWIFLMLLAASCASDQRGSTRDLPKVCAVVTNAINREDWATLQKLAKPGMLANNYGKRFEPDDQSTTSGRRLDYRVGKFLMVQDKIEPDGKTNRVYSFQLENKNGTVNPHWLQITVREEHRKAELMDFWNFGW